MSRTIRILLLDDNPDDRLLAIREFQREFSALHTEEIIEQTGLDRALAAGNFDVVITDYQLRWNDGIRVIQAVKARYPDCPVIMFTNTGGQETAVEAMKAGLDDYVLKSAKHYIRLPVAVKAALERAEKQRRAVQIEARLQSLLERLNVGVFRANQEGALLEGNAAFLRLLQVNSLTEAQALYLQQFYRRREAGSPNSESTRELQLQRSDGSRIWVAVSETLSTDETTIIDGLLEDISDRHSAEAEIRQLNENLERRVEERTAELAAANEELEAFSYSVSHDLREPLRAIQGFAQILLEDYAEQIDSSGQDYAHRIVAAASRLEGLIQDLLAYSSLSRAQVQRSRVDLSAVVAEVLSQLELELSDRQAQVTVEPPLLVVMGDRVTLAQAIANLIKNAVKFVPPGVQPQVRIRVELRQPWVRFWVEDNGIGVAPRYQEQIFRVFERLHGIETYPGTGIGLAIVQKGIERMGGRVGVESQPDQGSRFWLELPKAD